MLSVVDRDVTVARRGTLESGSAVQGASSKREIFTAEKGKLECNTLEMYRSLRLIGSRTAVYMLLVRTNIITSYLS